MDPKFYNRSGTLTAYAIACGYVDVRTIEERTRAELWSEHGVYGVTVRTDDADETTAACRVNRYRTLTEARRVWRTAKA